MGLIFLPGNEVESGVILGGRMVVVGSCCCGCVGCFGGGSGITWSFVFATTRGSVEGGSAFLAEAVDPFELGSLSSAMTKPASDFEEARLRQISRPTWEDPLLRDTGEVDIESPS